MPKIVDHDARRALIVDAAAAVIARAGLRATTLRVIAREIGVAPAGLAHYFSTREALIEAVGEMLLRSTNERITRATAGFHGVQALLGVLEALGSPTSEGAADAEARVVISFWNHVATGAGAIDHRNAHVGWHRAAAAYLEEGIERCEVTTGAPIDRVAPALVSLCVAGTVEALFQTAISRPDARHELVDVVLRPYLTERGVHMLDDYRARIERIDGSSAARAGQNPSLSTVWVGLTTR